MSDTLKDLLQKKEEKKSVFPQYQIKPSIPLRRIIKANGKMFHPDEFGVYTPEDEEEWKLCEHFFKMHRLDRVE